MDIPERGFPEAPHGHDPHPAPSAADHLNTPVLRGAPDGETERLAFILLPRFSTIAFASAMEPLRLANMLAQRELFAWTLNSVDGDAVEASSGMRVLPDGDLAAAAGAPNVMICSGLDSHRPTDPRLVRWLRQIDRVGRHIGAVCTGAFALAEAGLLDGHACTVHWANHDAFRERYPAIGLTTNLFAVDRRRFTCAGGTGALDMMLHHIAVRHGDALSRQVASRMFHAAIRDPRENDAMPLRIQLGTSSEQILAAARIMEQNIEIPVSLNVVAAHAGITPRQLQRLFAETLGTTPLNYYRQLRLRRAQRLLQQTNIRVTEVAMACGFISLSHFSSCYRKLFDHPPGEERAKSAHQPARHHAKA